VHPTGGQLVKPHPRPRYGLKQRRVDLARRFVTRGKDNPGFHAAALHRKRHEAGQTKNAAGPHSCVRTGNLDFLGHPNTVVVQFDPIDELGPYTLAPPLRLATGDIKRKSHRAFLLRRAT
jgi:hypothetical protein